MVMNEEIFQAGGPDALDLTKKHTQAEIMQEIKLIKKQVYTSGRALRLADLWDAYYEQDQHYQDIKNRRVSW